MFPYFEGIGRVYTDEELEEQKTGKENDIIDINKLEIEGITDKTKVALRESCNKILQHGLNNDTESLICLDKTSGNIISKMLTGNKNSVGFSQDLIAELLLAKKNSIIMIHNHPSSSSFSSTDIVTLFKFNSISDLIVVGHDKTVYTLSLGGGAVLDAELFKEDYLRVKNELKFKYVEKIKSKELTEKQAWYEHSNDVLNNLSNFYKWKYRRYKFEN